jgi:hypothetical protein
MALRKIKTDGFQEQPISGKCPECDFDMFFQDEENYVIGWGNYPLGGYRNLMKPNQNLCLVYECPKCFTKSVHHATQDLIDTEGEMKE